MKQFFTSIFLASLSLTTFSQDFVTDVEVQRTFNFRKDSSSGTGTCFLIVEKNQNYWITAKHVLGEIKNKQRLKFYILRDTTWISTSGIVLVHSNSKIDIAVIRPDDSITKYAINLDVANIVLGDEGFFMGFPFGMGTRDNSNLSTGFPFPLIKKCVFSGGYNEKGIRMLFLDGNNNPGFSGGPVFFKNRDDRNDRRLYLAGVISAYVNQKNQMVTPIGNIDYYENSGIILAFSSFHIGEILFQNGR